MIDVHSKYRYGLNNIGATMLHPSSNLQTRLSQAPGWLKHSLKTQESPLKGKSTNTRIPVGHVNPTVSCSDITRYVIAPVSLGPKTPQCHSRPHHRGRPPNFSPHPRSCATSRSIQVRRFGARPMRGFSVSCLLKQSSKEKAKDQESWPISKGLEQCPAPPIR